jgi:membrane-associated phospholipid phosphatase
MTNLRSIHSSFVSFAACILAVILCMAYIDRPVADFVQAHLHPRRLQTCLDGFLHLAPIALLLALLMLFAAGYAVLHGQALGAWARTPKLCAWSATWALSVAVVLKRVFGRSCVYPNYIVGHAYGFQPFHGVGSYESFPSGTTAVAAALLSVVWLRFARLRGVCASLLVLVGLALIMNHSHWVSDVIGGGFLGVLVGCMTVRLLRSY